MDISHFIWLSYYLYEQIRRGAESRFIKALSAIDRLSDLPGDDAVGRRALNRRCNGCVSKIPA